jgi:WD40 repeat protein
LALLADGRLASGGGDGQIKVWPRDRVGDPVILSHGSAVLALAVLPDGRLAGGGMDRNGTIKLWPDSFGEPEVLSHGSSVWSLAALADGRLASGGADGQIKLWPRDGVGGTTVLSDGKERVLSLAAMPDGQLASGDVAGIIKLWPPDGRNSPWGLQAHAGGWVWSLAVLADGRLASGGLDGQIILWPREVISIPRPNGQFTLSSVSHGGFGGSVEALVALADGRFASGGSDGKIKIWKGDGGESVVLSHGDRVHSLAVLADGRLASGGYDGRIKLWLVDEQKLLAALCLRAGRNLSNEEWARYIGPDKPWQPICLGLGLDSNWETIKEPK